MELSQSCRCEGRVALLLRDVVLFVWMHQSLGFIYGPMWTLIHKFTARPHIAFVSCVYQVALHSQSSYVCVTSFTLLLKDNLNIHSYRKEQLMQKT